MSDDHPIFQRLLTYEEYGPGYRPELVSAHNTRTAEYDAGFFIRALGDAQEILDCGCGRGSITIGIARACPSSQVIGCDVGESVLRAAAEDAKRANVANVRFQPASVYDLPFLEATFDAVIAHAVIQHLAQPDAALAELFRVLRPGGLIGLRDDDRGSMILSPHDDDMSEALAVMDWFQADMRGDGYAGRKHRERLLEAGFTDVVGSATCEVDGTPKETRARGDLSAAAFRSKLGARAVEAGRILKEDRERLARACERWGRHPAAFDAITWCEAIARKPR